jgi:hypothetical protein
MVSTKIAQSARCLPANLTERLASTASRLLCSTSIRAHAVFRRRHDALLLAGGGQEGQRLTLLFAAPPSQAVHRSP